MDQPKFERMLRLMKMMSGNINYTVEKISRKLEMLEGEFGVYGELVRF